AELNIDPEDVANPWAAAGASALAFAIGGVLPLLAILLAPTPVRVPITAVITLLALAVTGALGARLGDAPILRPTVRVVIGGALALVVTFAVGSLFGTGVV
ncbi:MAG: VIT1/CCC1 transporter family protein, partial [Propionibacteriales bacterium]|nr:VIT1/CCC1 transporter family protein [Propionibacteriales bacterium]